MTIARKPKEEERNVVEGRRKIRAGRAKERRRTEGEDLSDTFKGQHW